ncbi:MAG: cbb3-type cytochrome c oxidase subunit II [Verrucomicrobiota bacterium]
MFRSSLFFLSLGATFLLPWFVLIVQPSIHFNSMMPIAYDAEDEALGSYPPPVPNIAKRGQEIYNQQGCAFCHSQMIRPTYLGQDSYRPDWMSTDEDGNPTTDRMRENTPYDYLGEEYAHLGISRIGPDLSNVGTRIKDTAWHFQHLYNPRSINRWSVMPGYRHLFETRLIQGDVSEDALELPEKYAPPEGYEIVPTKDARALVGYLLTLKKDAPLPEELGGAVPGEEGAATPAG